MVSPAMEKSAAKASFLPGIRQSISDKDHTGQRENLHEAQIHRKPGFSDSITHGLLAHFSQTFLPHTGLGFPKYLFMTSTVQALLSEQISLVPQTTKQFFKYPFHISTTFLSIRNHFHMWPNLKCDSALELVCKSKGISVFSFCLLSSDIQIPK